MHGGGYTMGRRDASEVPRMTKMSASRPVTDIVGVDARVGAKLRRAGVATVSDMWSHAGDRTGRTDLSGITGIPADRLAEYARRADLMRIEAIGPRYAALLEAAGVTSLKQLRRRSAGPLHEALTAVNRAQRIVETVPSEGELAEWISRAAAIEL